MNPDAQQAADAAMMEIQEHPYVSGDPPLVVVRADWLRTFLTNFFDERLTKIGGEQASEDHADGAAGSGGTTPPATPIDIYVDPNNPQPVYDEWNDRFIKTYAQIRREVVEEFTMLLSDHAFIADGLDTPLPIAVVRMESVEHVSKVLLTEQGAVC